MEKVNDIGYRWTDIEKGLTPANKKKFNKFMVGQTIAIINKEPIVYTNDYELFLETLEDEDE